jgi:hypothetical protein
MMPEIVTSHAVDLTPTEALAWLESELDLAGNAVAANDPDAALDCCIRALGLALQLGPVATGQVLTAVLEIASMLASEQNTLALSALGPALVGVVNQVREAGVLAPTAVMDAWATIATDLGALLGQLGLVLSVTPDRRSSMLDKARAHAALLDDATGYLFALTAWLDGIQLDA